MILYRRAALATTLLAAATIALGATAQAGEGGTFAYNHLPIYKHDPHIYGDVSSGQAPSAYTVAGHGACEIGDDGWGWIDVKDLTNGVVGWTLSSNVNWGSWTC